MGKICDRSALRAGRDVSHQVAHLFSSQLGDTETKGSKWLPEVTQASQLPGRGSFLQANSRGKAGGNHPAISPFGALM